MKINIKRAEDAAWQQDVVGPELWGSSSRPDRFLAIKAGLTGDYTGLEALAGVIEKQGHDGSYYYSPGLDEDYIEALFDLADWIGENVRR